MIRFGCGIEAADRRRLPAERYSLSPLWVLDSEEEEEEAALTMNDNTSHSRADITFSEWCWGCCWCSLLRGGCWTRWRWWTSRKRAPAPPLPIDRGPSAPWTQGEQTRLGSSPGSASLEDQLDTSWRLDECLSHVKDLKRPLTSEELPRPQPQVLLAQLLQEHVQPRRLNWQLLGQH